MSLADQPLVPLVPGTPPLSSAEASKYRKLLAPWWELGPWPFARPPLPPPTVLRGHLATADFAQAMRLAQVVSDVAEQCHHHPELVVRWGGLELALWTHELGGLSSVDFIVAARIERALESRGGLR